jgi:protease-4
MKIARESVFISIIRSFFVSFFAVFGVVIALLLLTIFLSSLSSPKEPSSRARPTVLPNAQGERSILSNTSPLILQLDISGLVGSESLNSDQIWTQLFESQGGSIEKGRVKALLLRINSPGGSAIDSFNIYKAIKTYKSMFNVPVYAYVDGMCASGGMYIACAADKVFASDASIIGSVGVIINFVNFSQLMTNLGLKADTITEGKNKDLMNPMRPWKPDEEAPIKDMTRFFYEQFVNVVVSNRPDMNKENLIDTYGANIYPAPLAKEYHFIDEDNSSWLETLAALAKEANLENYQVIQLNTKSWVSQLFGANAWWLTGKISHSFSQLPATYDPKLQNQVLYLYQP